MSDAARDPTRTLREHFALIVRNVRLALGNHAKRIGMPIAFCVLIFQRIDSLQTRFNKALARGPIPPRKPRNPNPETPNPKTPNPKTPNPTPPATDGYDLPNQHGWLHRMLAGTELEPARHVLKTMLADPELQAAILANRTLGRILRPLCTMLAIKLPDYLRLPRRPRKKLSPEAAKAKADEILDQRCRAIAAGIPYKPETPIPTRRKTWSPTPYVPPTPLQQ